MTAPKWWPAAGDAISRANRQRLAALSRRSRQVLLLAGVTGVLTGLVVAGFDWLTADVLLDRVRDLPLAARASAPLLGLLAAAACLRLAGRGTTPGTADDYIRTFHDRSGRIALRQVPWKLLAAVATLGLGGPLGYEGPSIYAGAAVGSGLQQRLRRFFTAEDAKVLLVAGAAAGVAAIFKAPVTGLVFALEVPYQEDLARKMLLPAAIGAAASYVTFAAIAGTEPLLPIAGQPPFDLRDLGGAAAVGLIAGILARAFVALVRAAKTLSQRGHPLARAAIGGAVMAAVVLAGHLISDEPLVVGPGYDALRWALDPQRSIVAIIALGTLRVIGTTAILGGGGVGGLFIPLVIQGALVGRAVGGALDADNTTLFPVVGMAAFLGAGYCVPLAAVVFVAEVTGRPGFVVPGLIAAVVAQLVIGRASVSAYQVSSRVGHLEGRLRLPLSSVVDTDTRTVPPDATVAELFWEHLVAGRQHSTAVVDGDTYLGIVGTDQAKTIDRASWPVTTVAEIMRTDVPTAEPSWPLREAIEVMDTAATDRLAVCNDGRFVGVITATDLVQLDEILHNDDP